MRDVKVVLMYRAYLLYIIMLKKRYKIIGAKEIKNYTRIRVFNITKKIIMSKEGQIN